MGDFDFDETEDEGDFAVHLGIDQLDVQKILLGPTQDDDVEINEYIKFISLIPDLSADEEFALAQIIQKHANVELIEEIHRDQYLAARKSLIESALKIVPGIAGKQNGEDLGFFELIQEGNLGLVIAANKFDPHKGVRFAAFAFWSVRNSIQRAAGNQGTLIRLPIHMRERIEIVLKVIDDLIDSDEEVTLTCLRDKTSLASKSIIEAIEFSRFRHLSLEGLLDTEINLDQEIVGYGRQRHDVVFDEVLNDLFLEQLDSVLGTISEREAGVMRLRFGIFDGQPKTLDEIGKVYGVTRERIRQIESKTMSKLRHPSRSEVLRDYLYEQQ
jgi:RNA polymerase primary sigma factor